MNVTTTNHPCQEQIIHCFLLLLASYEQGPEHDGLQHPSGRLS